MTATVKNDFNLSTTHHSVEVKPWDALPGGVVVGDWGDVDPESGDPSPMLLLRDRDEVSAFVAHLWRALAESERR